MTIQDFINSFIKCWQCNQQLYFTIQRYKIFQHVIPHAVANQALTFSLKNNKLNFKNFRNDHKNIQCEIDIQTHFNYLSQNNQPIEPNDDDKIMLYMKCDKCSSFIESNFAQINNQILPNFDLKYFAINLKSLNNLKICKLT